MTVNELLESYLKSLSTISLKGDAREESYYAALSDMLNSYAIETDVKNTHITTLPAPTEAGNPDFRVWNGKDSITGYIEAKKPTEENLDRIEKSAQLKRYRETFPNLILTNFFEFRLYRDGVCIKKVVAARAFGLNTLHTTPPLENEDELKELLNLFFSFSLPRTLTAKSLAVELAKRTRFLHDIIKTQFEDENTPQELRGFYDAFKTYLIGSLEPDQFADFFAQTIAYGMFAARIRTKDDFNRRKAFDNIPHTIGVLRDIFRFISLSEIPDELAWSVDDIAHVLAATDAGAILDKYYHDGKGNDPIVHFYETFLAEYDPKERERRGVYYTPEPVVDYIVRSLHAILQDSFSKADGLADNGVTLLDPAAGTMTFIARAAHEAVKLFGRKYGEPAIESFIRTYILKNFYAFELMMAPYAVGHLKMSFFLEELGHRLKDDERMPFYLTNTLDNEELEQSRLPGFSALAKESQLAGKVKKQTPVLVIVGNPPYSGHSSNSGKWITDLIDTYKEVDGQPLGERNPKWLQDDYVKFLRFAQWKIEQSGKGVVGMITNHAYIDNPTFRGMRQSLMKTYDEIYILDLHGNSLKKETCPDGSPDKNVFDIRQGVTIAFFIKHKKKSKEYAKVYHYDKYGNRDEKYSWLSENDIQSTEWTPIVPHTPGYFFINRNTKNENIYSQFESIQDIFDKNSVGIVTARDALTIRWSEKEVWNTVNTFSQADPEMARKTYDLGKDSNDWKVSLAQKDIIESGPHRKYIKKILYRPFDIRYTYYTGNSSGFICRPRSDVMQNMIRGDNLALISVRQVAEGIFNHAFVTNNIVDSRITLSNKGIAYVYPLYIYKTKEKESNSGGGSSKSPVQTMMMFEEEEDYTARKINIHKEIYESLKSTYKDACSPENVFYYIYAILYSPEYRVKYEEFLRVDYPRIPFTKNKDLFSKIAQSGEKLVQLHTLEISPSDTIITITGKGTNKIAGNKGEGLRYDPDEQHYYINKTQYFAPFPQEIYDYHIGGYRVCEKWLKSHKGREMKADDFRIFCQMTYAISKTIEIQKEIDTLYSEAEKTVVQF